MISVQTVSQLLSWLTLVGDVFLGVVFLLWFYQKFFKKQIQFIKPWQSLMVRYGLGLAFWVALAATTGSLFYSEVARYTPCKLCWFQRIFMYPQVILLGVALWRKARDTALYVVPLSVMGAIIAVYHYFVQWQQVLAPCSLNGPDCTVKYTFHFGYITIPVMALTAFLLIILFTYLTDTTEQKNRSVRF